MESCDGWVIEVENWTKYNPRGDSTRPSWFRMENDIVAGDSFHGIPLETKWMWVIILSLVSKKNGKPITWNCSYVQANEGIDPRAQLEAIETFEKDGRLRVTRTTVARPACEPRPLRTNGRNVTNETNGAARASAARKEAAPELDLGGEEAPPPPKANAFVAVYCDSWKTRYQASKAPPITGKAAGIAKRLVKDLGVQRACDLVEAYMQMNDTWFLTKRHDLETFSMNLNAVSQFFDTGKQLTRTEIARVDRRTALAEAFEPLIRESEAQHGIGQP